MLASEYRVPMSLRRRVLIYQLRLFKRSWCSWGLYKALEKQTVLSLYLRKRLTIFLSVQVMGCSVSAGFWQILSRVTDELNKLERENHIVLSTQHLSEHSSPCSFSCTRSPLNKITLDNVRLKWIWVKFTTLCYLRIKCPEGWWTGFTWRVWHRGNRSWCDPESLSFFPLTKTLPLIQG